MKLKLNGQKDYLGYVYSFCFAALGTLLIFVPFVIIDGGLFIYCGDYNSQMMPFHQYVNDFLKSGAGQWSWETDLGSSFINSYSYYALGSPFFWLSALFPATWSPFLTVPMMVIKFGVSSLGAYMYLKRYSTNMFAAVLCACLYAFSGFTVYNTFFYIFLDCIALFPFMLFALDEFVYEKKFGLFALTVALNCLNNYFFFAGQIIFLFIYFFVKLISKEYKITLKRFSLLALESLLGVCMGVLFLLPAFISLMDNPRTVNMASGFGFLMYGHVQQYFAIFTSLFLPPDPAYIPSIYTEGAIKWTSLSAFLPVVSCVCVLCYMRARKKSAISRILIICAIMAFVPFLNSAFYVFNQSYYARWFYMPILLMCCATMPVLETYALPSGAPPTDGGTEPFKLLSAFKIVLVITFSFIIFGLLPTKVDDSWKIGAVNNAEQFWLSWLVAILGLVLFYIAIHFKLKKISFIKLMFIFVMVFSVAYSIIHVSLGKFPQWENDADYREEMYVSAPNISWPNDGSYYRIDTYEAYDNTGLLAGKSSLQFFHSTVTPSIMEFYPSVGVTRDVSSKPSQDNYALRGLLGTKYTLVPLDNSQNFIDTYSGYGYHYLYTDGAFEIFANANYVGMGFAYDKYITLDELNNISENLRSNMLVRAIGLTEEQIAKYSAYLTPVTEDDKAVLDYTTYVHDMSIHAQNAVTNFNATTSGFTAQIELTAPKLVFLSVPYEQGFTASVNGKEVEIEKVSNGMSAVLCEAGLNDIEFVYETPGLALSTIISVCGFIAWLLYCAICLYTGKKQQSIITKTSLTYKQTDREI